MKHISLYSCLGAMSIGFEAIDQNIETVMFMDPNSPCQHLLRQAWPKIPVIESQEQLLEEIGNYGRVEIVSARVRGDNWKYVRQTVAVVKPKIVVIEGMASLRSRGLGEVLKDLWSLGYDAEWHIISASTFGALYNGERLWIIAHPIANGQPKNRKSEESERGLGKQYLTDHAIDVYRTWIEGNGKTPDRTIFDKSRILRRNDWISKRVDSTRLRFLSDDVSPIVAGFIGMCVMTALKGSYYSLPPKFLISTSFISEPYKRHNLWSNTERLINEKIPFTEKNNGLHLKIQCDGGVIVDYWPSTDTYLIRGTKERGSGVEAVISRYRGVDKKHAS